MDSKFAKVQREIWKPGTLVRVGYDEINRETGIVLDFAGESLGYINVMIGGEIECIVNPLWNKPFSALPSLGEFGAVFKPICLMPDNPYYHTVADIVGTAINMLNSD